MCGAGADDNCIGWIEWAVGSVGMNDGDLEPGLERDPGTGCEAFVDFDGDDAAMRADNLGEDGRVVACATTKMKDVIARMDVEQAQMKCPKTGLTIVEALGRVENNERVLVNIPRICAFSEGLCAADLDHPWAGADEAFAGNGGECGKNGGRGDAIGPAQFLGERAPRGFD